MSSGKAINLGVRGYVIFVKEFRNEKKIYFRKQKKDVSSGKTVLTNSGMSLTLDEWTTLKSAIRAIDMELQKVTSMEESPESVSKDESQFLTQSQNTNVHQKPPFSGSFQILQHNGNAQNYEEQEKDYLPRTFTTSELNSIFEALGPEMELTGEQQGLAVKHQVPSWGSEMY